MCESDQCVFYREDYSLIILLYIDDVIISYECDDEYERLITKIKQISKLVMKANYPGI